MSEVDAVVVNQGSKTLESPRCSSGSSSDSPLLPDHLYLTGCKEKWPTFPEADGEPLLPGLPDEVTLAHIAPKLMWREFYVLASVSPAWCQAIRSRQVYDARVRSLSTETLIIFSCKSVTSTWLALYSRTDHAWYKLPSIPKLESGIPDVCKCVALNGKIYVLGVYIMGAEINCSFNDMGSSYVFDLVGQKQWQKCDGIEQLRDGFPFECGVLDGKIYAFGGRFGRDPVNGSKVFDPETNTWSPIKAMTSLRFEHRVAAVGDELFIYGGKVFDADWFDWARKLLAASFKNVAGSLSDVADSLDVYHPARDEWRVVENFHRQPRAELRRKYRNEVLFMAQGTFHSMSQDGIHVYSADKNSWTYLHSCSWALLGPVDSLEIILSAVLAVNDELFALVDCYDKDCSMCWKAFIRSGGLGSENKELEWEIIEKIPYSFEIKTWDQYEFDVYRSPLFISPSFMSLIHL